MAIQDDFTLNYTTKKISHTSGSTRYTVNALYSWLMDLFDDQGQMDDPISISAQTPTEYTLINGWTFNADSDLDYLYGGSIVVQKATTDRDVWGNFYSLGSIEPDGIIYWNQNGSLVATHANYTTGHIDQLIKIISNGAEINSRKVTAFIRNRTSGNADLYDHFEVQATATGGRNPVPLATSPDSNDTGSDVSAYTITINFANTNNDVGQDGTAELWKVTVDAGNSYSCSQVYEYLKYITRAGNTSAVGTGNATQGRFYTKADTTYSEVKPSPFATFAGGKIFGARGVLITNVTDSNNRVLIDADNVTRTPPVTISISVTGIASGDSVLVARSTAGVINKSQFTLSGNHTGASTITVVEAVANDIPSSGIIRFGDTIYTYSGINRGAKQFSGLSPTVTQSNLAPLYIPIIDVTASSTSITANITYSGDFEVLAVVRKKGIIPFSNTGTVTNAGLTLSAIRTTDTIVT